MTIQHFCQGRLAVVIAAGWTDQEFANLGARMSTRRRQLRAWKALVERVAEVAPGRVDLAVDGLEISDATIAPGFVGGASPQMWMAGHGDGAPERAAALGYGTRLAALLQQSGTWESGFVNADRTAGSFFEWR